MHWQRASWRVCWPQPQTAACSQGLPRLSPCARTARMPPKPVHASPHSWCGGRRTGRSSRPARSSSGRRCRRRGSGGRAGSATPCRPACGSQAGGTGDQRRAGRAPRRLAGRFPSPPPPPPPPSPPIQCGALALQKPRSSWHDQSGLPQQRSRLWSSQLSPQSGFSCLSLRHASSWQVSSAGGEGGGRRVEGALACPEEGARWRFGHPCRACTAAARRQSAAMACLSPRTVAAAALDAGEGGQALAHKVLGAAGGL